MINAMGMMTVVLEPSNGFDSSLSDPRCCHRRSPAIRPFLAPQDRRKLPRLFCRACLFRPSCFRYLTMCLFLSTLAFSSPQGRLEHP